MKQRMIVSLEQNQVIKFSFCPFLIGLLAPHVGPPLLRLSESSFQGSWGMSNSLPLEGKNIIIKNQVGILVIDEGYMISIATDSVSLYYRMENYKSYGYKNFFTNGPNHGRRVRVKRKNSFIITI